MREKREINPEMRIAVDVCFVHKRMKESDLTGSERDKTVATSTKKGEREKNLLLAAQNCYSKS